MRSQCAVYIDAGYLLAATATRVTGTSLRSSVEVDHPALIEALIEQAEQDSGMPLLRVNWYDSGARPNGLPDYGQERIGLLPKVKLRLGRKSPTGEQKGVDLRIGLDLATHGRQRVVDVMYLVSGDDDLTEAVEEAQSHGVQVTLLVVPNHAKGSIAVAKHLQRAADGVLLITDSRIDAAVKSRSIPDELVPAGADGDADAASGAQAPAAAGESGELPTAAVPSPAPPKRSAAPDSAPAEAAQPPVITPNVLAGKKPTAVVPPQPPQPRSSVVWSSDARHDDLGYAMIDAADVDAVAHQVIEGWCRTATPASLKALKDNRPAIPGELDRALLMDLSTRADVYDIPEQARYALRDRFWALVDKIKLS